jgi:hemoglobin
MGLPGLPLQDRHSRARRTWRLPIQPTGDAMSRTRAFRALATLALAATTATWLQGCASGYGSAPLNDGQLAVPADYKRWPKFLSAVQRPDAKQVREIYMNPEARSATAAGGFANGTVFVMENYAAQAAPDGSLATGPDGKLVKGNLLKVFVMGKGPGWGQGAPENLRNGNWVYGAYLPNGQPSGDDLATCRACHLPLAGKDFVHRYDEHFASR